MLKTLGFLFAAAALSVGCQGLEPYTVDAPEDLADQIAAYQAEQAANKRDDYVEIPISAAIVGAEDNTSGWWTEFSQYFNVPSGWKLHVEFDNFGSGENNWNNWNVCVANGKERDGEGYAEYFVLRSDAYGWGNADYNGGVIEFDMNGGDTDWDLFRVKMNGAAVSLTLDHSRAGAAYLEVTSVASDGFYITEKYNQKVSATEDINAFLVCDASHFNVKSAWLTPSEIQEIPDEDVVAIAVNGLPSSVEIGSAVENILATATAVATFADNSTSQVPIEDVDFQIADDITASAGVKTILYSYSKTKLGNFGRSVAGSATIEVTNPIVAIEAEAVCYTIGGAKYVVLSPYGVKVTGTYADGAKTVLKYSQYSVNIPNDTFAGTAATYADAFTVSYTTSSGDVLTANGALTVAASSLEAQAEPVGLSDCTTPWWTAFSRDWKVEPGTSQSVSMVLSSDNAANFHSPCTILRKADMSEYGVVRMDHYGWGGAIGDGLAVISAFCSSNWNWDTFAGNLNGSQVAITVSNCGEFASIRYHVISADGSEHFQYYDNIAVDGNDVQFAIVTEGSYLIFD